jgi:hypothetical protein
MLGRKKNNSNYSGVCTLGMGGWRLTVARRVAGQWQSLEANKVFTNLDILRGQFQMGEVQAGTIRFNDDGRVCFVDVANKGLARVVGSRMVAVLNRHYATFDGVKIAWKWDIVQYD